MCCNVNDDQMASCWSLISIVLNRPCSASCIRSSSNASYNCSLDLHMSRERDDGDNDMLCCLAVFCLFFAVFVVVWFPFLGLLTEERTMPFLPIFHFISIFS